jgi:hypothetical protein
LLICKYNTTFIHVLLIKYLLNMWGYIILNLMLLLAMNYFPKKNVDYK